MSTTDFITELFCRIDDQMKGERQHSQAKLAPSEVVTLATLYALKGAAPAPFYRWVARDYRACSLFCLNARACFGCLRRIGRGLTASWPSRRS